MHKLLVRSFSLAFAVLGFLLLFSSGIGITGAVIGSASAGNLNSLLGFLFLTVGVLLFAAERASLEKLVITNSIGAQKSLQKLAEKALRNQTIEREINHLIKELSKGNFEAGLGRPRHVDGTPVFYIGGRNGGRLYYRRVGQNSYEIVAKSGKGRNQDQVIEQLKQLYSA